MSTAVAESPNGDRTISGTERRLANLRPPWKPGQTGNPAGSKPLAPELKARLAELTPPMIERLLELATQEEDLKVAHSSAVYLIDRNLGKPTQRLEAEITRETVKTLMAQEGRAVREVLLAELGESRCNELCGLIQDTFERIARGADAPSHTTPARAAASHTTPNQTIPVDAIEAEIVARAVEEEGESEAGLVRYDETQDTWVTVPSPVEWPGQSAV